MSLLSCMFTILEHWSRGACLFHFSCMMTTAFLFLNLCDYLPFWLLFWWDLQLAACCMRRPISRVGLLVAWCRTNPCMAPRVRCMLLVALAPCCRSWVHVSLMLLLRVDMLYLCCRTHLSSLPVVVWKLPLQHSASRARSLQSQECVENNVYIKCLRAW